MEIRQKVRVGSSISIPRCIKVTIDEFQSRLRCPIPVSKEVLTGVQSVINVRGSRGSVSVKIDRSFSR